MIFLSNQSSSQNWTRSVLPIQQGWDSLKWSRTWARRCTPTRRPLVLRPHSCPHLCHGSDGNALAPCRQLMLHLWPLSQNKLARALLSFFRNIPWYNFKEVMLQKQFMTRGKMGAAKYFPRKKLLYKLFLENPVKKLFTIPFFLHFIRCPFCPFFLIAVQRKLKKKWEIGLNANKEGKTLCQNMN